MKPLFTEINVFNKINRFVEKSIFEHKKNFRNALSEWLSTGEFKPHEVENHTRTNNHRGLDLPIDDNFSFDYNFHDKKRFFITVDAFISEKYPSIKVNVASFDFSIENDEQISDCEDDQYDFAVKYIEKMNEIKSLKECLTEILNTFIKDDNLNELNDYLSCKTYSIAKKEFQNEFQALTR